MDEGQPENPPQEENPPVQEQQQPKQEEYYPPTSQQYQYKIFINQCNGYIGSQLVQLFRNDDEIEVNPNIIISSLNQDIKHNGQTGANQIIDVGNKRLLSSVARSSDIIVYTLSEGNQRDFQYLVKLLRKSKNNPEERKKKLILVSSCLTWNSRRGNHNPEPALENLASRNSTKSYLMELENMCLDINNHDCGIQSFVVCAGMVYGYGENQLFSHFKKALQQSEPLKIYGKGTNKIPMVHLEDLCAVVKEIAFHGQLRQSKAKKQKAPLSNYYFAVDDSQTSQSDLMKAIAQTLGNGAVESIPIEDSFLSSNFDQFTIDLKIQQIPSLSSWHCKEGLTQNLGQVVSEFNLYRGLKPNKIMVTGPPAAGKSKIAQILAAAYGLPILTIKSVVQEINNEDDQFAQSIKVKIQEIRTVQIEEQRKAFEEAKKKKKGKKDAADEFDPAKVVPRLPEQDLISIFKRRLNKSDCLNKGYILDGWPKTAKSCELLFLDENSSVVENIFPNSCFLIEATEEEVKERIKNLPADLRETTHWNEQATIRRFQVYTKNMEEGGPNQFLKEKVDVKTIQFAYEDQKQFVEFVERNGPLGFKKKEKAPKPGEVEDKQAQGKQEEQNQEKQEDKKSDEEPEEEDEVEDQQPMEEEPPGQFDLEKLTEHEKQILNEKSRPIRQYLIDNVIPQITEGLLEICKDTPQDPIGFLIKFLENKQTLKAQK